MSNIVDTLVEMGFPKNRAELAVKKTSNANVESAMEWLLTHEDEPEPEPEAEETVTDSPAPTESVAEASSSGENVPVAKSIKCDECEKLFKTQLEVEFHSTKSGHTSFSESTEEKKPLTEEEKREQLAKIEAKLRQRRLEREAREKQEELEREKVRIKSGKELLEAKKKQEELEIKKIVEQRKREKEEDRLAKQRVREQIEQDKLARKAKFGGSDTVQAKPTVSEIPKSAPAKQSPQQNYSEVQLQIRLTNSTTLKRTFGAKEPLSSVRLYVELNRNDGQGPFSLMIPFPRKVFDEEDYEKPLDVLGLAPSAVLVVTKTQP